jgi:hypothetical protein
MKILGFRGMKRWTTDPSYVRSSDPRVWRNMDDDTLNTLVSVLDTQPDDDENYPLLDLLDEHHCYIVDDLMVVSPPSPVRIGDSWCIHVARNLKWFDGVDDENAGSDMQDLISYEGKDISSVIDDDGRVDLIVNVDQS